MASVVRDAIDRVLPPDAPLERTEAGGLLLDADPIEVGDWSQLKNELLDRVSGSGT